MQQVLVRCLMFVEKRTWEKLNFELETDIDKFNFADKMVLMAYGVVVDKI